MTPTNTYVIPAEELVVGGVYTLQSRNLKLGVWDGEAFIGIREKFDSRFLDREYLRTDTAGTAHPKEFYFKVDESVKLVTQDNKLLFDMLDRVGKEHSE